ncbi:hypothetical protein EDEG_01289 [Edhazardia aedis USNM 41457]|uniref:Brl1/Brr6 domain-containing protein n=1 Tax=Edhazardia aedis (strain USNM 41457) TaxID=1003232 RepID=J9D9Q3_EDHAE|nr:hypothetical protein EDEG_01289 [Edhazardia aedis USNM 41457]|eukprot:EJW04496.1 hypothetical protein EDEG_01289 [Edhazardia aedis USNM 41457]
MMGIPMDIDMKLGWEKDTLEKPEPCHFLTSKKRKLSSDRKFNPLEAKKLDKARVQVISSLSKDFGKFSLKTTQTEENIFLPVRRRENSEIKEIKDLIPVKHEKSVIKKEESVKIAEKKSNWFLSFLITIIKFLPRLPNIILHYIYVLYTTLLFCTLIYFIISGTFIIKNDIQTKINARRIQIRSLIERSKYNYNINKCHPSTRVPALQDLCETWECQMNSCINSVEILRIIGEVLGEVIDAFVSKVSFKTVLTVGILMSIYMFFRRK